MWRTTPQHRENDRCDRVSAGLVFGTVLGFAMALSPAAPGHEARAATSESPRQEELVRFLGATVPHHPSEERVGVVGEIFMAFEQRRDRGGMIVTFERGRGIFSTQTKAAILLAIDCAARIAGLRTDSWSVGLAIREPHAVVYGDSLTAMVALSVVALAKGDAIRPDRVVTGTVRPTGRLGLVSAVSLKVEAAHHQRLRRVIVPDERNVADPDWRTPFLMQISPVASVREAYAALTDAPLTTKRRLVP